MPSWIPDLTTKLGPLELKNPVMTASGTFGYGLEYGSLMDLNRLGAVVVKGLSLKPMAGNPPPRIVETACGMLNAIGLANVGLDAFLGDKLPKLRQIETSVIVNIYGHHIDEYGDLAGALKGVEGVHALEVNVSCPNVDCGGMAFGIDPAVAASVTERVVKNTDKPVIVKLSPNVTDIKLVAKAVQDAGADVVSLINTITGMAVDVETRTPKLANVVGGLSGPAIKPVALHMVYQVARTVNIPVNGLQRRPGISYRRRPCGGDRHGQFCQSKDKPGGGGWPDRVLRRTRDKAHWGNRGKPEDQPVSSEP
jgi:dihydroorotate dehydrogenase (NAD+) catalytic subunit